MKMCRKTMWAAVAALLLCASVRGGNLLSDPGFEADGPHALEWTNRPWCGGGGGETDSGGGAWVTADYANDGSQAAKVFLWGGGAAWAVIGQTVTEGVEPFKRYKIAGRFLRESSIEKAEARIAVMWIDVEGDVLSTNTVRDIFDDTWLPGEWHTMEGEAVAPAHAAAAKYEVLFHTGGAFDPGDIWFDEAFLGVPGS